MEFRALQISVQVPMPNVVIMAFWLCFSLSAADSQAASREAGKRVALVLGNSSYQGIDDLPNVRNDVRLITKKLRSLGFETKIALNSSRKQMLMNIREFGGRLNETDVALFYYAGHAIAYGNANYLIPSSGAGKLDKTTLEFDAVELDRVLAEMRDSGAAVNIVIMDACRDNPFKQSSATRSIGNTQGLQAPAAQVKGMYIAYSTSPGTVALDGEYSNSPYTRALAQYIDQPGLGINEIFTKVRRSVIETTDNAQVPWEQSSLTDEFYFASEQADTERAKQQKIETQLADLKQQLENERRAKAIVEQERKLALQRLRLSEEARKREEKLGEKQTEDIREAAKLAQLELRRLQRQHRKEGIRQLGEAQLKHDDQIAKLKAQQMLGIAVKAPQREALVEKRSDARVGKKHPDQVSEALINEGPEAKLNVEVNMTRAQQAESAKKSNDSKLLEIAKAEQRERQNLARLDWQETQVAIRKQKLIAAMLDNCQALQASSASGQRVLKCFKDVLERDANNKIAKIGIDTLKHSYQKKLGVSLEDERLAKVNREYALLQSIEPNLSRLKFGERVQNLRDEKRKLTQASSRRILPTF